MTEYDRIAGLSAQLSELGQHLAFRSSSSGGAKRESGEERAAQMPIRAERQSAGEAQRADVAREIDMQLAILRESREFLLRSVQPNDQRLRDLDAAEGQLSGLRENIQGAGGVDLSAIRRQIADSMRSAGDAINSATAIAASTGSPGLLMTRMAAEATYNARMTSIENAVNGMLRQDAQSFGQTADLADRFGVDIGAYRTQRDALLREAEEKEKQGDRYGAITAKTLSVWNTYYTAQEVADGIDGEKHPAEKAAAQRQADEDRARAERAEQEQRKAAQADATKAAGGMHFPGGEKERDEWIKSKVDQDMDAYQGRKAGMHKPASLSEDQARSYDASIAASRKLSEGAEPAVLPDVVVAEAGLSNNISDRRAKAATGFSESPATPYEHDAVKLPAAAQEQAKLAAAPVAQDTANAATKDGEPKLPGKTPAVQVAEAGKSSVTI